MHIQLQEATSRRRGGAGVGAVMRFNTGVPETIMVPNPNGELEGEPEEIEVSNPEYTAIDDMEWSYSPGGDDEQTEEEFIAMIAAEKVVWANHFATLGEHEDDPVVESDV